ncbi:MAG: DUF3368 domain-containing protein [Candidatus Hydrothermarchaeales archaeon]
MLVFDSTPIIYLAKVREIEVLKNLSEKKIIPEAVYSEVVVRGKELGKADANVLENAVRKQLFEVMEVAKSDLYKELSKNPNLTKADVEVLTLAKNTGSTVILDDEYARDIAQSIGLKTRGTISLLFRLLHEGIINKKELKEILDGMIKEGWRCSTVLYSKTIKKLEDI